MKSGQKPTSRNVRACAARVLVDVLQHGRSLGDVLPLAQQLVIDGDRALLAELCYGTLRFFCELDELAARLLQKPPKEKDYDVHALLLTGFYQLRHMRVAEHTVVNLTVEASRALQKDWAGKLLNAVLRNYLRDRQRLDAAVAHHHNHPLWLFALLEQAWPAQADAVFAANNSRGGMTLRVNRLQQSRDDYQQQLSAVGIASAPAELAEEALLLQQPVAVSQLPGFAEGCCSVQDVAAQLCVPLLRLQPGLRVLDACCAPGGKTGHILESETGLASLVAIDSDETRLQRVRENLARLGLSAKIVCADAGKTGEWYDNPWLGSKPFDRILLDAPCSGTGVIRRHPDIKHLRRESDIAPLVQRQRELLDALWPLLAPGGILLYTTCSILPQENEQLVSAFLRDHPDAVVQPIDVPWGIATQNGRQLLPAADHDGFFFARLVKP